MTLEKYKNGLFDTLLNGIIIKFDEETKQYTLINNETPGIFGLGDTKEEAVDEYISDFKKNILIKNKIQRKYGILEIEEFSDKEIDILMKNKKLEKSRNNINKLLASKGI